MESKVVSAVGIIVHTQYGARADARLRQVMSDAVLACNAEGISCDDANSGIIRMRMQEAYERELAKIQEEVANG